MENFQFQFNCRDEYPDLRRASSCSFPSPTHKQRTIRQVRSTNTYMFLEHVGSQAQIAIVDEHLNLYLSLWCSLQFRYSGCKAEDRPGRPRRCSGQAGPSTPSLLSRGGINAHLRENRPREGET
jgi:hypothetical protein